MSENKNFKLTWREALKILGENGYVDIETSGGDEWNHKVAVRLTDMMKQPVVFIGVSPEYEFAFRFTMNIDTNRQAASLLKKEY